MNLLKGIEIAEVGAPVGAASSTDQNSDRIDMQNLEGVIFLVPIIDCEATGVATLTVEQSTADSDTAMAALSGAVATATCVQQDDLNNTLLMVDVYRPRERYVQAAVTSGTANIAFGNTIAIKYGPRKKPTSQGDSVSDSEVVAGPAES